MALKGKLSDATKICGVSWKRLKSLAMLDNSSDQYIDLELNKYEQILLGRFIQAENLCEDFVNKGDFEPPKEEILILAYFAGHGC